MTEGTISLIIIGLFLVVLLAGFLFGLWRGLNKSLVRMLLVIASAVAAFFLAPVITKWIINLDISNFGINVGGVRIANLGELLRALLKDVPYIADLEGTQAFDTIMQVIPQMIANVVMFVVLFYLIRLVTMIIYWIIAGIAFSKKKTEGKNKLRLCGSLVGAVQGLLIFLVLLVPVAGTINILGEVERIVTTTESSSSSTTAASIGDSYNVLLADEDPEDGEAAEGQSEEDSKIVTALKKVNEIIDIYKNTWVGKFISGVKLDVVCDGVFTKLSTIEQNGEKYVLKEEMNSVAYLYTDVKDIRDLGGLDFEKSETLDVLQNLINHAYKSKLTSNIINELVPKAAEAWTTPDSEDESGYKRFLGIARPSIKGFDGVLEKLLEKFNTEEGLQETLNSTVAMVKSLISTANKLSGDEIKTLNPEAIGDLLTELSEDPAVFELAKDVIVTQIDEISETIFPKPETEGDPDDNAAYRNIVTEVVSQVLGHDYEEDTNADIKNEITVVTTALDLADKLTDSEKEVTQEDVNAVVGALNDSTVLLDVLSATDDDEEQTSAITQEIQKQLDNQDTVTKEAIENMINTAINNLEDDANAQKLREIFFGLSA
ncbi:MAG: CvpA family protein [Clostridia bacterium]|nr:CvpA family protein [Clostridia bacterium]